MNWICATKFTADGHYVGYCARFIRPTGLINNSYVSDNTIIIRFMIIDFHTHIFPQPKGAAILSDLSGRAAISHYTDGSLDSLLQSMQQSGIKVSFVSRISTRPEGVATVNLWLQKNIQEGIWPMATVHPELPDLEVYIATLKNMGFKGIKLHLDYQGCYADDRKMYPVYEAAQALRLPILFHAGLDRGLPPPVRATPRRLLNVHQKFQNLTMIAAHMGGEDNYDETETHLLGTNIYFDTSFVLRIMGKSTLKRFFSKHPIDRFLFGTDSPFTDQTTELNYFWDLPFLNQDSKEKILGLNAVKLMDL